MVEDLREGHHRKPVKREASIPQRLVSVVVAVLFLWAAGPDAYGAHPCPHHGALPAAASAAQEGANQSEDGPIRTAGSEDHHQHDHHPDGPCTCVETCPAPDTGAVSLPAPATLADASLAARALPVPVVDTRALAPRHSPYELHLPNAPPAFPS